MPRVLLAGHLCLVVALASACTAPDTSGVPGADGDQPGAASAAGLLPPVARPPSPVATMADGTHSVFGLRIPGGMKPVPGPHKVYRFESGHPLPVVKRQVMRQVETGTIVEEANGYLIRKARVLKPMGEADPATRLAVRIFRGRKGGATLDVWIEPPALAERNRRGSGPGSIGRAGSGVGDAKPVVLDDTAQRSREAERRKTLEALEKLESGKRLDPEEADNPLFY